MRWLADECVSALLVAQMRQAGHDVLYVAELTPGATDVEVTARASAEGRLLLTEDKDFGELVVRRRWPVPGIIILRTGTDQAAFNWTRLEAAIAQFGEALSGHLTVIEEARLRSRPLRLGA
jgi:predicted nuclease of predicted toxin-antitoxin system